MISLPILVAALAFGASVSAIPAPQNQISGLPACFQTCFDTATADASCVETDPNCYCKSQAFQITVMACINVMCELPDQTTGQDILNKECLPYTSILTGVVHSSTTTPSPTSILTGETHHTTSSILTGETYHTTSSSILTGETYHTTSNSILTGETYHTTSSILTGETYHTTTSPSPSCTPKTTTTTKTCTKTVTVAKTPGSSASPTPNSNLAPSGSGSSNSQPVPSTNAGDATLASGHGFAWMTTVGTLLGTSVLGGLLL